MKAGSDGPALYEQMKVLSPSFVFCCSPAVHWSDHVHSLSGTMKYLQFKDTNTEFWIQSEEQDFLLILIFDTKYSAGDQRGKHHNPNLEIEQNE